MWNDLLEKRWFLLPALSGACFVLGTYPYDLWPLTLCAVFIIFYFGSSTASLRRSFWGGALAGALWALSLSLNTTLNFFWPSGDKLFAFLLQLGFIPIVFLSALCSGIVLSLFWALRTTSPLLNGFVAASLWTFGEVLLYGTLHGYDFLLLAYSAPSVFLPLASWGGMFFLSFLLAWIAAGTAQYVRISYVSALSFFGVCIASISILAGAAHYTKNAPKGEILSVSVLQLGASADSLNLIGRERNGIFSLPAIEQAIREAASSTPDVVVYPFSVTRGFVYENTSPPPLHDISIASTRAIGTWLNSLVPTSTSVMTWEFAYDAGAYHSELEFYKEGAFASKYQKHVLLPFFDYTPSWAASVKLQTTVIQTKAGSGSNAEVKGVALGGAICSELYNQNLLRDNLSSAGVLLSVGTEQIAGDAARIFSLKAAQLRAAELGTPVIRANMFGPSALIDGNGRITSELPYGEDGVLTGSVFAQTPSTVYGKFGNIPLLILMGAFVLLGVVVRVLQKKNYRVELQPPI